MSRSTPASIASRAASRSSAATPCEDDLADAVPVADDDAVEAPLALEHVAQQVAVRVHRHAVDVVEGRHHAEHAGLDRGPERPQVQVAQGVLADRHGVVVAAARRTARSRRSAWRTRRAGRAGTGRRPGSPGSRRPRAGDASTGDSPNDSATRPQRGSSERSSIGAKVQAMPSTTASRGGVLGGQPDQLGVEGRRQAERDRGHGAVAVDHVAAEEHRDRRGGCSPTASSWISSITPASTPSSRSLPAVAPEA